MVSKVGIKKDTAPAKGLDVEKVRKDFPVLQQQVKDHPLVYLDNAATAQKPLTVIESVNRYYRETNSNVHRGVHTLSDKASSQYEEVREKIRKFINASSVEEIIFVRGATEGINLVASTFGKQNIGRGDEVVVTRMEHHSDIVPWQILCEEKGAHLKVAPVNEHGELELDEFDNLLTGKTKLVGVVHLSNSLGTINPVKKMIEKAHKKNIPVLVDGAQAVPHLKVDVTALDCDFYVFSGHKVFGPTGIGVLYGKKELLEEMPPYQGGGDMILEVKFEQTLYNDLPYKFEAGTPNIAGTIGLGAALDYLEDLGWENIEAWEKELTEYARQELEKIEGMRIIGDTPHKVGVFSLHFDNIHPQDVGVILDQQGIAIRTGHHCTQPLIRRFNIPATSRASFAFYNTRNEVDLLVKGIKTVKDIFG